MARISLLLGFFLAGMAWGGPGDNPESVGWARDRWLTAETEHFRIHYEKRHEDWVGKVARSAEGAHARISPRLNWTPKQKTELTLVDDFDASNGWAKTIPFPSIRVYLTPPDAINSLESSDDWLDLLLDHEYTHILHTDKSAGFPAALQKVFGRFPLFYPGLFQPAFLHEGLATANETDVARRIGRGQSAYYAMLMRMEVKRGLLDLNQVTQPSSIYPYGTEYLYGVYFIDFLQRRYGSEKLRAYLDLYSRNPIPFWLNPTARSLYDKDFPQLWDEMRADLRARFEPELAVPPVSAGKAFGEAGRSLPLQARNGCVYALRANEREPQVLQRWRNPADAPETLVKLKGAQSFDVGGDGRVLITQNMGRADLRVWSDLFVLEKGDLNRLTEGERWREARWLQDGRILARRIVDGVSELALLDDKGRLQQVLWRGTANEVLGQFAVSPAGDRLVAARKMPGQDWQLDEYNLSTLAWKTLVQGGVIGMPSFAPDGKAVLFSADFDGRYQIRRLDLGTQALTTLTQADGGAFHPAQDDAGQLYYQRFDVAGFQPHWLAEPLAMPTLASAPAPRTPRIPVAANLGPVRDYSPWASLRPRYWLPVLSTENNHLVAGVMSSGGDALDLHQYAVTAAFDNLAQKPLGSLSYMFSNRYQLSAWREFDVFQNSAIDKTERINAKDHVELNRYKLFNLLDDQLALELALIAEKKREVYRREGSAAPASARTSLALAGANWHFSNVERYRESIAPAFGRSIRVGGATQSLADTTYRGRLAGIQWDEYLGLGGSVLSLHALGIKGSGARSMPISLGGANPSTSPGENFFIRSEYPLRGYRDNAASGTSVGVASVQWDLPLARINRGWNIYPLGLRDLTGALFVDAGKVWGNAPAYKGETLTSVGAELGVQTVFGNHLILPIQIGVARGLHHELGETRAYARFAAEF